VLVLPGFGAGDASTAVLRAYLRYLGHRPRGWGLGRNTGDVPALLTRVLEQLDRIAAAERQPVSLIGWSLAACWLGRRRASVGGTPGDHPRLPVIGGPNCGRELHRARIDLDAVGRGPQPTAAHDTSLPSARAARRRRWRPASAAARRASVVEMEPPICPAARRGSSDHARQLASESVRARDLRRASPSGRESPVRPGRDNRRMSRPRLGGACP
jgi:hypothetical protein